MEGILEQEGKANRRFARSNQTKGKEREERRKGKGGQWGKKGGRRGESDGHFAADGALEGTGNLMGGQTGT